MKIKEGDKLPEAKVFVIDMDKDMNIRKYLQVRF